MKKNLIRETIKELELQIHGLMGDGFTPMEAQLVYNVLEDFEDKIKERCGDGVIKPLRSGSPKGKVPMVSNLRPTTPRG